MKQAIATALSLRIDDLNVAEVGDGLYTLDVTLNGVAQQLIVDASASPSAGRINAYAALRMTLAQRDGKSSTQLAKLDAEDAQDLAMETKTENVKRDVAFH